jgi:hypothetical protein
MQSYKTFNSAEFTDRDLEFARVEAILKDKNRGAVIFEGDRGSGKTTFLFELFRRLRERSDVRPFLISLFPYAAPEFEGYENIWLSSERRFQKEDILQVLNRLSEYLGIETIPTEDPGSKKDYLARGLATYRPSNPAPVLLIDSIYECAEEIRLEIEKNILAPLLSAERVFIFLSGRGKRPVWSRPELQTAEIIELHSLEHDFVIEQLQKLEQQNKLQRSPDEFETIFDLSGGNPLVVRVLAESKKDLAAALNDAIDILLGDTLPESIQKDEKGYMEIRSQIEKLSLVGIPFRVADVEAYLYPTDPEARAKTSGLINLLLASHLARYERQGYRLNPSVVHPIRKWLALQRREAGYRERLWKVSLQLQEKYPVAKEWYRGMLLQEETSLPGNMFNALHPNSTQSAA